MEIRTTGNQEGNAVRISNNEQGMSNVEVSFVPFRLCSAQALWPPERLKKQSQSTRLSPVVPSAVEGSEKTNPIFLVLRDA